MKPKPCPYCGHAAQVLHVMEGQDYQPLRGTHPEVWCPRCQRATMCPCALADDEAAYGKPWTALQMIGRWNAGWWWNAGRWWRPLSEKP